MGPSSAGMGWGEEHLLTVIKAQGAGAPLPQCTKCSAFLPSSNFSPGRVRVSLSFQSVSWLLGWQRASPINLYLRFLWCVLGIP